VILLPTKTTSETRGKTGVKNGQREFGNTVTAQRINKRVDVDSSDFFLKLRRS